MKQHGFESRCCTNAIIVQWYYAGSVNQKFQFNSEWWLKINPILFVFLIYFSYLCGIENKSLWEILVPTVSNEGKPYRTRFHKVWDAKVRTLATGLTILTPAKGHWLSPAGDLYSERMIPVRILCTESEINKIIDFTINYYDQLAVLAYEVSTKYILKHK